MGALCLNDENKQKETLKTYYTKAIRTRGKTALERYKTDENKAVLDDASCFDGDSISSYAFLLAPKAVLLDADTDASSKALKSFIDGEGIACRMSESCGGHGGIHATFIDEKGVYEKGGTKIITALGVPLDVKTGRTNGLEIQKCNGNVYPILKNELGNLPIYLQSVKGGQDLTAVSDGDRNDTLYKHFMALSRNGFTWTEAREAVLFANKYVLGVQGLSLVESEIEATILSDGNKIEFENGKNANYHQDLRQELLESYLKSLRVQVRFNELSNELDFINIPVNWQNINQKKNYTIKIMDGLKKLGVKRVSEKLINSYLDTIGDEQHYHPCIEWLNSASWDGISRLQTIYSVLNIDNEFYKTLIKKWLIQCVAILHNTKNSYVGIEGVLVLIGKEGIGKTLFFQKLVPCQNWFKSVSTELNLSRTDDITRTLAGWIVEISEIDATLKHKRSDIKSFITAGENTLRLAYDARQGSIIRKTSFAGTTNEERFLSDSSGYRRFWCIPVSNIDLDKMPKEDELLQFWLEIKSYYDENNNSFRLDNKEKKLLFENNTANTELLPAEEELLNIFDFDCSDDWEYRTCSQIRSLVPWELSRYSLAQIGKALSHIAKFDTRVLVKKRNGRTFYYTPPKLDRFYTHAEAEKFDDNLRQKIQLVK